VFARGSGSTRHSPRNAFVAEMMNNGDLATLLFDLLTPRLSGRFSGRPSGSCEQMAVARHGAHAAHRRES
jgi:hypothetical protein